MQSSKTPSPSPCIKKLRLSGDRDVSLTAAVGRGTQSTVYAASIAGAVGAHRAVAVKIFDGLPDEDQARVLAALARAAAAAACVTDPRVVQVYDFDFSSREPFIVTELVDGGRLEMLIDGYERQDRQLPQDVAILIGLKVAEGLEAALRARMPDGTPAYLVHGNLSTRDVLVSWSGEVKVKGFGFAPSSLGVSMKRGIEGMARLSSMSPEVAHGHTPDARSDVFSLGMLLRQMLLGQRFSPHTGPAEAIRFVREGVVHTSLHEQHLLGPLRLLLRRATDPRPERRHAHVGEVATELRKIAAMMGIPDVPAFIAHAVEDAFAPELVGKTLADDERREEQDGAPIDAVAELVAPGYEMYADVVEIAPRTLRPPLPSMPSNTTGPITVPTPPPAQFSRSAETAIAAPAPRLLASRLSDVPRVPPRPSANGKAPSRNTANKTACKAPRPRQQSGVEFRSMESAPTIVTASPWFDEVTD